MIGLMRTGALVVVLLASCSGVPAETASPPKAAVSRSEWEGTPLEGLGVRSRLWDVAVNEAGVFVAVGTDADEHSEGREPLAVWRSDDGISWREVFRRRDVLEPGDASGLAPANAVVADGAGFALVGGDCPRPEEPVEVPLTRWAGLPPVEGDLTGCRADRGHIGGRFRRLRRLGRG